MKKRLVAKTGEYQNSNNETKGEYVNIGVILSNENGEYALLDPTVNLAGVLQKQNMLNHSKGKKTGSSVMVSLFTDQPNQQPQQSQQSPAQPQGGNDFSNDTPF